MVQGGSTVLGQRRCDCAVQVLVDAVVPTKHQGCDHSCTQNTAELEIRYLSLTLRARDQASIFIPQSEGSGIYL